MHSKSCFEVRTARSQTSNAPLCGFLYVTHIMLKIFWYELVFALTMHAIKNTVLCPASTAVKSSVKKQIFTQRARALLML